MDKQDKSRIDELYSLYGFRKDADYDYCTVYVFDQGYFSNAEIIVSNQEKLNEVERVKQDYINSGYSVSVKENCVYEILKDQLFFGFFKIEQSNKKIIDEYGLFCKKQTARLGEIQYIYIKSNYTINGELGSEDILELICKMMRKDGMQLIILEAPAGFGKTCTSYEISNMIAQTERECVPILAELSKNRRARIFQYVLLEEMDRKFSQLSSNLVRTQIQEGRIPLIIDGFDELLSRIDNESEHSDDAISMLDTIASLLQSGSQSKILLTSRKSSIFTGDIFDEWVENNIVNCNVSRIQIIQPTLKDWIGSEKRDLLKKRDIRLDSISNPVLLSMLKNMSIEECDARFRDTSDVLEVYINLMLEREISRQELLLEPEEQRKIMRGLASMMVQFDVSSGSPEEIKTLIETFIESRIGEYMRKYNEYSEQGSMSGLTEDEFVMKLVHSALLDRVGLKSNDIGFINEFIFGIFIGEAITNDILKVEEVYDKYLNIAITSFSAESQDLKDKLYHKIESANLKLDTEQKLMIGFNLKGALMYDYVDKYIADVMFESSFNMNQEKYFYNCVFSSCTFDGCEVDNVVFEGCHFIGCNFYELKVNKVEEIKENSIFISCNGHEELMNSLTKVNTEDNVVEEGVDDTYFKRLVLEQFWMPGSERAQIRKSPRTLYKGIDSKYRKQVSLAIASLKSADILLELTYCLELNKSKMNQIKLMLGR